MEQSQQSAPSVKGSPEKHEDVAACLILNPSSLKAEDYQTDDSQSQGEGSDCNSVEHEYGPASTEGAKVKPFTHQSPSGKFGFSNKNKLSEFMHSLTPLLQTPHQYHSRGVSANSPTKKPED